MTGAEVYEGYGLTETSPVVSIDPGGANLISTIGIALPGTEIRIIADTDEDFGMSTAASCACVYRR